MRRLTCVALSGFLWACGHQVASQPAQTLTPLDADSMASATLPEVITCPPPQRPPDVLVGHVDSVLTKFIIDTTGRPASRPTVVASSNPELNPWAIQAALGCQFRPARLHGRAVAVYVEVPFRYN